MGKIDTVLFDFDGTIMDTNDVIFQSWDHTFMKIENRVPDRKMIAATFGEPLEITLKEFFPNFPINEALEVYRSYHRDNFGELINLFPGVLDMLKRTKQEGYKTGLVTSRLKHTTIQGLEKYGIIDYFDCIVTAEDGTKYKPDPEPIEIALEKLGSNPNNAVMLGDTVFDIECARNANVRSILVSWSIALESDTQIKEAAPDYILNDTKDLFEIIS